MSTFTLNQPFSVLAPAKLNIRLKITGRRPDGYHELVSIMVPVDLFDHITLTFTEQPGINISCRGFSAPANADNLVCRAAQSFFSQTDRQKGLSIDLTKRIPVAAGLGGGSSDAAAILMTLNQTLCASQPLPSKRMAELALELGADIPFFLKRSPCIARGIGEILEPIRNWPSYYYVIVMPDISVSTAKVYEALDSPPFSPRKEDNRENRENRELVLTNDEYHVIVRNLLKMPTEVCRLLENDLERVTVSRFPVIREIKQSLLDVGAIGALMSGSGPSVFGVFESEAGAYCAKAVLDAASSLPVFVVKGIDSWGVVKW
ncbi:MAG: 4-(cytidine 5'-diphospho)-2-C-methyl-D-erythritol kinase [Desulfobacteraceae bacterium 4572_87]|nr:MAG: 4-(cytidine 5'-diphospho)-2-C-methyl-D-erythritol kinase [Desulfobacteraceae bacterium 4572_87]